MLRPLLLACLVLAGPARGDAVLPAAREGLLQAVFADPTARYDHGVLGDELEWGALVLTVDRCPDCTRSSPVKVTIRLPETRVFEDLAPRLFRGDTGETLAMVVETDLARGARLSVYSADGLYAATPFIGRSHRWLAPVAAGDLDGDGWPELAYVETPHLGRTLRVWRLREGQLAEVAQMPGVTAHRIGWDYIAGGLRDCDGRPEIVLASADWSELLAIRFDGTRLSARSLGRWSLPAYEAALVCQ